MTSKASRLVEHWSRLEHWLEKHAPADFEALRAGASEETLRSTFGSLPFPPHSDLVDLFAKHDGVRPRRASADPGKFFLNFGFLRSEQAMEQWRYLVSLVDEALEEGIEEDVVGMTAHEQWLPFAESLSGDVLFVDHRPGEFYGNVGELSFGDPQYRLRWVGLAEMLTDVNTAVASGDRLEGMPYVPVVFKGQALEWVVPV